MLFTLVMEIVAMVGALYLTELFTADESVALSITPYIWGLVVLSSQLDYLVVLLPICVSWWYHPWSTFSWVWLLKHWI